LSIISIAIVSGSLAALAEQPVALYVDPVRGARPARARADLANGRKNVAYLMVYRRPCMSLLAR
jgi:hypothetical protein